VIEMDFDFDISFFSDITAWIITIVLWAIFMSLIWLLPDIFGGNWKGKEAIRIIITIASPFVMYLVAKVMLERG
jgi:hypothetical protein